MPFWSAALGVLAVNLTMAMRSQAGLATLAFGGGNPVPKPHLRVPEDDRVPVIGGQEMQRRRKPVDAGVPGCLPRLPAGSGCNTTVSNGSANGDRRMAAGGTHGTLRDLRVPAGMRAGGPACLGDPLYPPGTQGFRLRGGGGVDRALRPDPPPQKRAQLTRPPKSNETDPGPGR